MNRFRQAGEVTVAFAYPGTEQEAMADPSFQTLSGRLKGEDLVLERIFLPEEPSPLRSLESGRPLPAFDVLLLFLPEDLEAFYILTLLERGGLPLLRRERGGVFPAVFLTGPLAALNPEPFSDFIDAVLLEEEAWEEVLSLFRQVKGRDRLGVEWDRLLQGLLRIPGVYVPMFYEVRYKEEGTIEAVIPREEAPLPVKRRRLPGSSSEPGMLRPGTWKVTGETLFTIEVGAGTEPLRALLGRPVGDLELFGLLDRFAETPIPRLQLLFLIGLPGETDRDLQGIAEFAKGARHRILERRKDERRLEVIVSLQTFIPRPWTVFQWASMGEVPVLEAGLRKVEKGLRSSKGIRLLHDLPKWAYFKALFARGDRRLSRLLLLRLKEGDWERAFLRWPLNPDFFARRPRPFDEVLPWDHLGTGKELLIERYLEMGL